MKKKQIQLPTCVCGGEAKRIKLFGKPAVKCTKCGKRTRMHATQSEATKEWKRIAGLEIKKDAAKESPKTPKTPKAKPAAKPLPKAPAKPKPAPEKPGVTLVKEIACLSAGLKHMSILADEIGRRAVNALGVNQREVLEAIDKGVDFHFDTLGEVVKRICPEAAKKVEMKIQVVDGEKAKRLVEVLRKAGVIPAKKGVK